MKLILALIPPPPPPLSLFLGGGEMISDVFLDHSTYAEPPSRLVNLFLFLTKFILYTNVHVKCMNAQVGALVAVYISDPTFTKTKNRLVDSLKLSLKTEVCGEFHFV